MAKTKTFLELFEEKRTTTVTTSNGTEIEVTYRPLTMNESDNFTKRMFKNFKEEGVAATIDYDAAAEIKYEKLALCIIEPKITVEDLKQLPISEVKMFNKLSELIEPRPEVDEKGNLKD